MAYWTPYATAVFHRRFGHRADDDDLQELRLIIWEALRDHDPEQVAWRPFLWRRVIRRTIDRYRTQDGRQQQRWHLNHPLELNGVDPAAPDFTDAVLLGVVLDMLPPRDRQALVDTYVVGRTCAELAAEWGVHESRVWQIRAHAARRVAGWLRR